MKIFGLIVGSILGGLARYYGGGAVNSYVGGAPVFPWGTFFVNLTGCFLMGLFAGFSAQKGWFDENMRVFLMTGFCGALTTFSAFIFEVDALTRAQAQNAVVYILASILLGFALFRAGHLLTGVLS
jgi:CrcB protein